MSKIFLVLFFLSITAVFSSYFIYPAVVWFWGKLAPLRVLKKEIVPKASILIPAYNEEKNIARKLDNTLRLLYPAEKLEILVGTDGASDNTADIVREYEHKGVRLFEFKTNRGKTAIQNDLVKAARGQILVFTDAASFLHPESIKRIVNNFADDRVGCVAGRMRYVDTNKNLTTQSQGLYWRYEVKLREFESRIGSVIGVDGPLYAVRSKNYVALKPHMISDLVTPLLVLEQGKRVVLEPEALVDEDPTQKSSQEFSTRRRVTLRGLIGIFFFRRLLNPIKYPILSFQLIFHKIIRWFAGFFVLINLISSFILADFLFFQIFVWIYLFFFASACLGYLTELMGFPIKFFRIPYYFILVNLAASAGIFDFIRKKQIISWQPVRD